MTTPARRESDPEEIERLRSELEQCLGERAEIAQAEIDQRRLIENLTGGYFFYRHAPDRTDYYVSPSVVQVLGYTQAEYVATYHDLFTDAPANVEARRSTERAIAGEAQYSFEVELRAKDGSIRILEVSEVPVFGDDGGVILIEGIAHDISERRRAERRLQELATVDELTGLFNRRHFRVRLEEAISLARRHDFPLSMAMIDLDGLKSVNDGCGHAAGDRLICAAAEAMKRELRKGDVLGRMRSVVGRLGGDEFAALLPFAREEQGCIAMTRLLGAFARDEVEVAPGERRPLRASVGVADLRPEDSADSFEKRADRALYRAKREARGTVVGAGTLDS